MKLFSKILAIAAIVLINACSNNSKQAKNLVTERIQYDVNIKTPDPDLNWYVQNIEGSSREKFIKNILTAVYNGKVQAYDADGSPLSMAEVKNIENSSDTLVVEGAAVNGDDTVIVKKTELDIQRITKIMFLEEWYMNEDNLHFEKKVLGICPLYAKYDDDGSLRGFKPLFWIYFDKRYPLKNTNE